ncbi:hypothetical protein ACI3PL_26090, partial [Lacticaseibacillus paracasei]
MSDLQWHQGGSLDIAACAFDLDVKSLQTGLPDPSTGASHGIICPANNNPAWTKIDGCFITGRYTGIGVGEHAEIERTTID